MAQDIAKSFRLGGPDIDPHAKTEEFLNEARVVVADVAKNHAKSLQKWADFGILIRKYRLRVGRTVANEALQAIFRNYPESPLKSSVWGRIPLGVLANFSEYQYSTISIYGEKSENPVVRQSLLHFLSEYPNDPYIFLAYYGLGQFDEAIAAAEKSGKLAGVLYYAAGHKKLAQLFARTLPNLDKTRAELGTKPGFTQYDGEGSCSVDDVHPKCYFYQIYALHGGPKDRLSAFLGRATEADQAKVRRILEQNPGLLRQVIAYMERAVELSRGLPHDDDAHYYLGVINRYLGKRSEALAEFEAALRRRTDARHGDYVGGALHQVTQMMLEVSDSDRLDMVSNSKEFSAEPTLWYVMARDAYRRHDYEQTILIAETGIAKIGVEVWRLPVTTDASRIEGELQRLLPNSQQYVDTHLQELVYLLNASREMSRFASALQTDPSSVEIKQLRAVILKYSLLTMSDAEQAKLSAGQLGQHRDLRQAIYLADLALKSLRRGASPAIDVLREWLMYRKVRILVQFQPEKVEAAVKAFEEEYPRSKLLDDAYVELLYAQAFTLGSKRAKVDATFRLVNERFPKENAIDNAYSWYAIYLQCIKDFPAARSVNMDIVRKFPISRHAVYATARLASNDEECQIKYRRGVHMEGK